MNSEEEKQFIGLLACALRIAFVIAGTKTMYDPTEQACEEAQTMMLEMKVRGILPDFKN